MERKVNAPDKETLDDTEAATWLGIKEGVFLALAKRIGLNGITFGPRTRRWHWQDLVSILHLLSRGAFSGDSDADGGQSG